MPVAQDTIPAVAEAFEVMAQNVDCFRIWLACETQWRAIAGMGPIIWLGLDYSAVDVVLRRSSAERQDEIFADLRLMEDVALSTFRETDR